MNMTKENRAEMKALKKIIRDADRTVAKARKDIDRAAKTAGRTKRALYRETDLRSKQVDRALDREHRALRAEANGALTTRTKAANRMAILAGRSAQ